MTSNLINKCQTSVQNGCSKLHSHQQCMNIPVTPYLCQQFVVSVFLILTIVIDMKLYITAKFSRLLGTLVGIKPILVAETGPSPIP